MPEGNEGNVRVERKVRRVTPDDQIGWLVQKPTIGELLDEFRNQQFEINQLRQERDKSFTAGARGERERCARMLEMTNGEIRLLAGEMTASEMRTVKAVLNQRARAIRDA